MLQFTRQQWRVFNCIRRKHKVSMEFLQYNLPNILKFIAYYGERFHFVLKCITKRKGHTVIIKYNQLSRSIFDEVQRKRAKRRRRHMKQWSKQMVEYLRKIYGVKEYTIVKSLPISQMPSKDITKQLKEQLALLKTGKRSKQLIEENVEENNREGNRLNELVDENDKNSNAVYILNEKTGLLETLNGKQIKTSTKCMEPVKSSESFSVQLNSKVSANDLIGINNTRKSNIPLEKPIARIATFSNSRIIDNYESLLLNEKIGILEKNSDNATIMPAPKSNANFLDLLMSKVRAPPKNMQINDKTSNVDLPLETSVKQATKTPTKDSSFEMQETTTETDLDSGEEFLGFAEDERLPGMMRTPLVPRTIAENTAFVSKTLDEYFRENSLDTSIDIAQLTKLSFNRKLRQTNIDGLMTPNCKPPALSMPALPDSLLKLRTVAERRQYLQKNSRNPKLAIINNEATIYRELQRKMRQLRNMSSTQQALQAPKSQMSFTYQGWQAASFINTELNKYYYQKLNIKGENGKIEECVNLRGVCGNNTDKFKQTYHSRLLLTNHKLKCDRNCMDCYIASSLVPIETFASKKKLCNEPRRSIFKACPLSEKAKQTLYDEDAAQIMLKGGGMAVIRLPTVELEVCPELGKSFNDIAKRYLQYIMPYQDITREWAEFSVSTLYIPSNKGKVDKNFNRKRKSFIFAIPYANDQSQILVRRVVHRDEKIEPFFLQTPEPPNSWELNFHKNVDTKDKIAVECADLLSDMINSVAISCCENSFITKDPEELATKLKSGPIYSKKLTKQPTKVTNAQKLPPGHNNKKTRLFMELRRLNATIIDAQSELKNETRQCSKEFCALGCICASLDNVERPKQHCGRLKCMFDCKCNSSNTSQIVRVESDGRSITTEDAFMMRRQATARLARIEKEFTSTIVVTESETLLINESAYEKKRRAAKLPKRYADYDDEYSRLSPVKTGGSTFSTEHSDSRSPSRASELHERVLVDDVVLNKLKHCSVALIPFNEVQNMPVFCMVHQLYKCFCGGRAIDGKRIIIEKENTNLSTLEDQDENLQIYSTTKSRYSFEKTEEVFSEPISSPALTSQSSKSHYSIQKSRDSSPELSNTRLTSKPKASKQELHKSKSENSFEKSNTYILPDVDVNALELDDDGDDDDSDVVACKKSKKKNFDNNPLTYEDQKDFLTVHFRRGQRNGCTRFVPVPSTTYRTRNRKKRANILNYINSTENKETQLLLNEHIMRSVYYHKEMVEAEKRTKLDLKLERKLEGGSQEKKLIKEQTQVAKRNNSFSIPCPIDEKKPKLEIEEELIDDADDADEQLNEIAQVSSNTAKTAKNSLDDDSVATVAMEQQENENYEETESNTEKICESIHNEVIKTLNGLVSRKMHDIDNALKRDSKIVPPPTEDILCVLHWRNFAEAYRDGLIYVWEVKMKTRTFLAATVKNIIPLVPGALGIMNIRAVPNDRLPLLGRMLVENFNYNTLLNLAIIMQGRSHYWYIKGFLQPNGAKACLRPTPETHPELTQKINTLCTSLIKQRSREHERQMLIVKQKQQQQQQQQQNQQQIGLLPLQQQQQQKMRSSRELGLRTEIDPESITAKDCNTTQTWNQVLHQPLQQKQQQHKMHAPTMIESSESLEFSTRKSQISPDISQRQQQKIQAEKTILQQKQAQTQNISKLPIEASPSQEISSPLVAVVTNNSQQISCLNNIEIRQVDSTDIAAVKQPIMFIDDHRWLVLDLFKVTNDFSHIFIPELKEIIELERILRLMHMSIAKQKVVRIEFHKKVHNSPHFYLAPNFQRKIYFGPFPIDKPAPVLVLLLQGKNGEMLPRETYDKLYNKTNRTDFTTAFWMTQINRKLYFDEVDSIKNIASKENEVVMNQAQKFVDSVSDSDDDCMIVENGTKIVTVPKQLQTTTTTTPTKASHLNFTIQTSKKTNSLEISTLDGINLLACKNAKNLNEIGIDKKQREENAKILSVFKLPTSTTITTELSHHSGDKQFTVPVTGTGTFTSSNLLSTNQQTSVPSIKLPVKTSTQTNANQLVNKGAGINKLKDSKVTIISSKLLSPAQNSHSDSTQQIQNAAVKVCSNNNINKETEQFQKLTSNATNTKIRPISIVRAVPMSQPNIIQRALTPTQVVNSQVTPVSLIASANFPFHDKQVVSFKRIDNAAINTLTPPPPALQEKTNELKQFRPVKRLSSGLYKIPNNDLITSNAVQATGVSSTNTTNATNTTNLTKFAKMSTIPTTSQSTTQTPATAIIAKPTCSTPQTMFIPSSMQTPTSNPTKSNTQLHQTSNKLIVNKAVTMKNSLNSVTSQSSAVKNNNTIVMENNNKQAQILTNPNVLSKCLAKKTTTAMDNLKTTTQQVIPANKKSINLFNQQKTEDDLNLGMFGYFYSNHKNIPRFLAKRFSFGYVIKFPDRKVKGISVEDANTHLNNHIAQLHPHVKEKLVWTFAAQKKVVVNTLNSRQQNTPKAVGEPSISLLKQPRSPPVIKQKKIMPKISDSFSASPQQVVDSDIILIDD